MGKIHLASCKIRRLGVSITGEAGFQKYRLFFLLQTLREKGNRTKNVSDRVFLGIRSSKKVSDYYYLYI